MFTTTDDAQYRIKPDNNQRLERIGNNENICVFFFLQKYKTQLVPATTKIDVTRLKECENHTHIS